MDCINLLNNRFDEAVPAIFGFQEAWNPLKHNIYPKFKVMGHAPYEHSPDAAFLDPEGVAKLLPENEQKKILIVRSRFFITSKKDVNNKLFNSDVLQRSKKAVVDFVQENIKKYYEQKGEKLTRILFGMELEIIGDSLLERNFTPTLDAVIRKWKDSYTAAEIRMVYKLMKEIPDEDIQYIANQSIRFVKVVKVITNEYSRHGTSIKVEFLDPPWLGKEAEWANRTRKEGRSSYEKRKENVPEWVSRLIKYKNDMKTV